MSMIGVDFDLQDPYWEKLLWHCSGNSSYQGCPPPEMQNHEYGESFSGTGLNNEEEDPCSKVEAWNCNFEAEAVPKIPKPVTEEAEGSDGWK